MERFLKNFKIPLRLILLFILLFSSAALAVDVKFSVDMTNHIKGGLFNPAADKVYLRGSFNNWDLGTEMQRLQETNIYVRTVSVPANSGCEYKYFINTPGASNDGWESTIVGLDRNGNRRFVAGTNNIELAVMYFDNSNMSLKRETDHFLLYCDPKDENILNAYAARLEDTYKRITFNLEVSIGSKIHVEIFKDLKTLHTAAGYPEDPDWARGSAIGKTVIISVSPNCLNEDPSTTGLLSIISHEFVHTAEAWKMSVPLHTMVNEGTAMYLSEFPFVRSTTEVRDFIKELGYKPTFAYFEKNFGNHGYAFAGTVADFIVVRYGIRGLARYIGNAVPSTLGYASFAEFEAAWHKFLEDYYMSEENPVTKDKAEVIAVNWYKHWNPNPLASDKISNYFHIEIYNMTQMHVFNFESGGFVMIAASDRIKPVMGYNFSSNAPEGSYFYRDLFCSHMDDIRSQETLKQWENIYKNDFSSYSSKQVTPMLTTHWHQWWPYNAYYPLDPTFYFEENGHYRTSCGPIAAAQVIKYWNYPVKPRYNVKINDPAFGKFTFNYDTVRAIDWKNMPDFLPVDPALPKSSYDASAYLLYNLVIAGIHMPGAGGGGSCANWAGIWATHFDYSFNTSVIKKENYSYEQWKNFYDTELDNGRPMLMSASTDMEGQGGHYFIVDGYQADDYYHINLGWADVNGYIDGYYPLENLGGFRFNNLALIGLEPRKKNIEIGGAYQNDEQTVALFHFNGNLDNSSAISGNAVQHGSGISFTSNDSLGLGQSLRIDNSTSYKQSYITVPHNSGLNLDGDWTIEAWFCLNSWGNDHTAIPCLLSKPGTDTWDPNYEISFNPGARTIEGRYRADSPYGNTVVWSKDSTIELRKWYHISYIREKKTNNIKMLIHNIKRELVYYWTIPYSVQNEANPRINAHDLFIGWIGKYNNTYFDGYIDELRISNGVRDFQSALASYVTTYPGDADDDGIVKASDVLPLGIYYGKTGAPRLQADQGCGQGVLIRTPWDTYRATFADCNGDGTVDVADILCIGYNYNKTSSAAKSGRSMPAAKKKTDENPVISLSAVFNISDPALKDSLTVISIKLSNVKELLGVSFDLSWDPEILEIITDENNIMPGMIWDKDALFISRVFNEKGLLEFGITNRTGSIVEVDGEVINLKARVKKPGNPSFKIPQAFWTDKNGEKYELSPDANLTTVDNKAVITKYELTNFPNPFNPLTQIKFSIAKSEKVSLRIFNTIGQQVAILVNSELMEAGEYNYAWSAAGFASGVYFCRLETPNKILTRKLMVIK